MTTVYLVRHAEAEGNIYRRAHGHFDGRVTTRGEAQIEKLKNRFEDIKIDAVYSSDLFRTCKTASAVFKPKRLTLNTDERLREVNVGLWEDVSWGDIGYTSPEQNEYFGNDPARWSVEGSEGFANVRERMTMCIAELAKRHDGGAIAVFSHGFAIRAFLSGLLGVKSHEISKVPYCDNTAAALLRFEKGAFEIEYHGDNSHLRASESTFARQSWWKDDEAPRRENLRFTPFNGTRDRALLEQCRDELPTEFMSDAVYTALLGEEQIGFLGLDTQTDDENAGLICHIYIKPQMRKKGFGVQLLGQAVSVYRRLGRERLRIITEKDSAAAIFFQNNGFEITSPKGGDPETGSGYLLEKDISLQKYKL